MYKDATTFTSDLMNSYAWDTATLFLQTFGTNSKYSIQTSLNSSLATTGTNNQTTKDVQCNVYDIASNIREFTTETSTHSNGPCLARGGSYCYSNLYMTSGRGSYGTSSGGTTWGSAQFFIYKLWVLKYNCVNSKKVTHTVEKCKILR